MQEDEEIINAFLTLANGNERAREYLLYKLFNHASIPALRDAMDQWFEHLERLEHIKAHHIWDSETDTYRPPS